MVLVRDSQLEPAVQCSFYKELKPDLLTLPAIETLKWAVRERHAGKIRTAPEIRERFVKLWNEHWTGIRDGTYWAGPKSAIGLGRRLHEFLLKYRMKARSLASRALQSGTNQGEKKFPW